MLQISVARRFISANCFWQVGFFKRKRYSKEDLVDGDTAPPPTEEEPVDLRRHDDDDEIRL